MALKIKINKEGLSGDELAAIEKLEKNMSIDGETQAVDISKEVGKLGLTKAQIENIVKALDEDNAEGLQNVIKGLKERIDTLEAEGEKKDLNETKGFAVTKEAFKKAAEDFGKFNKAEIVVKAPAIMTTANVANAPHLFRFEVDRSINEAPRPAIVIFNRLVKQKTNARTIYWANRVNKEGGAAFIAEGALKPLMDWEYAEQNSTAKKVAVRTRMSRELLSDFEGFNDEVRYMMTTEVKEKIAADLLTSTESATAIKGIIPTASTYTTTALDDKVEKANMADAIRAGMLQLRLLNFVPTVVFVNPGDAAVLDLTKDANGQYIKLQIDGVLQKIDVVETTEIAAGKFLLMDESKWRIKILEDIRVEFGLSAAEGTDDFANNLISAICEARLHSYINSIDVGAVLYGDFATIIAAILKPV